MMMKKFLSLTLLVLLTLPLFAFGANGTEQSLWEAKDPEELWERKLAAEGEMIHTGVAEWVIYLCPFMGNDLTVLFYTDAFDDLTFERRIYENDAENGASWELPCERETLYLPALTHGYEEGTSYLYSEELSEILDRRCMKIADGERTQMLPYLRGCIEEFGITKEELLAAYELSRTDPDAIREKLSCFTDEEFALLKKRGLLSCAPENDYIVDALYLPDEGQCRELCLYPYATEVDGRLIFCSQLMHDDGTLTNWLLERTPTSVGYLRFLQNAVAVSERYDWLESDHQLRLGALCGSMVMPMSSEMEDDELDFLDDAPPPKTGEGTALYLSVLVAAAAGFLAVSVCFKKKKAVT
jgi:hypothetical protein